MNDTTAPPVAEVRSVTRTFGPTRALDGVTIGFRPGVVHCLLGENGAGKSTVGKVLGGLIAPESGTVAVDGVPVRLAGVADAQRAGIVMVYQELSLVPDLTVRENVRLGMEGARSFLSPLRRRSEARACRALFDRFGLEFDLEAPVRSLPVARQQLLEIAKALARRPRLLILDEPTAMLGVVEQRLLIGIIERLKAEGVAIVFVTHHVEEVLAVADTVSLMKDGRVVESFPVTRDMDAAFLVGKLTGGIGAVAARAPAKPGAELLRFSGLTARHGRLAALSIRAGEVIALYGVVGCGREQLARAAVGLARLEDGTVRLAGRAAAPSNPHAALGRGIAFLSSGRAAHGILAGRSIRENLMLTQLSRHGRGGFLRPGAERRDTEAQLAALGVRYGSAEDPITSLSGGNQQKVLLGRCLESGARLVVLEDPTAGVDIGAKHDIHARIRARARDGLGVLLISGDLQEAIALADVIYTIADGTIVDEYRNPTAADEAAIVADILGHTSGTSPSAPPLPGERLS